jgi:hypothetical protein
MKYRETVLLLLNYVTLNGRSPRRLSETLRLARSSSDMACNKRVRIWHFVDHKPLLFSCSPNENISKDPRLESVYNFCHV